MNVIKTLLAKGEQIDAKTSDNKTALHIAVEHGKSAAVEVRSDNLRFELILIVRYCLAMEQTVTSRAEVRSCNRLKTELIVLFSRTRGDSTPYRCPD